MKRFAAPVLASLFALGVAFADEDVNFEALDQDGDGQLSRTDVAQDPYLAANFSRFDADGDGYLSQAEVEDAYMQRDYQEASDEAAADEFDAAAEDDAQSQEFDRVATEDDYQSEDYDRAAFEEDDMEDDGESENQDDDWK